MAVMIPLVSVFGVMGVIGGLSLHKIGRFSRRFGYVLGAMAMVIFVFGLRLGQHLFWPTGSRLSLDPLQGIDP